MNILAIDSSGLVASTAVMSDNIIKAEANTCNKLTHSETLMPMIDTVIRSSGLELGDMDHIAVACGPGSFTGLRIGCATAKGLAEAIGRTVIPVNTIDALAMNMYGFSGNIVPMIDARRNEAYTGIFRTADTGLETVKEQCAIPLAQLIDMVNELGTRTVFLGDGADSFRDQIDKTCTVEHIYATPAQRLQRAASVACLAVVYAGEGRAVDPALHAPIYLRSTQAEREGARAKTEAEKAAMAAGHVVRK